MGRGAGCQEEVGAVAAERRLPPDVARQARRKPEAVHVAAQLADLRVPPGNRVHALKGDRDASVANAGREQGTP